MSDMLEFLNAMKQSQQSQDGDRRAPDHLCEGCGDAMDAEDVNVEAFELSGKILCRDCADQLFKD